MFEILCYFKLLLALSRKRVNLRYIRGSGGDGHRFPYGPAKKENFLFFRFVFDNIEYDLCCGTNLIEEPYFCDDENDEIHPDISLQESTGASRAPGKPIAIWDAKYHEVKDSPKLVKGDLNQMNYWCTIFRDSLLRYEDDDILDSVMPSEFSVNSVISNAQKVRYSKDAMLNSGFSMVCEFKGDTDRIQPYPSRAEHVVRQNKFRAFIQMVKEALES